MLYVGGSQSYPVTPYDFHKMGIWTLSGDKNDIYAYQTNRTKEAKYE